jgi:hypothetical protein
MGFLFLPIQQPNESHRIVRELNFCDHPISITVLARGLLVSASSCSCCLLASNSQFWQQEQIQKQIQMTGGLHR